MDHHAETAPSNTSFVSSTHFPSPCVNGESGKRAGMPPPRRSSLPPLPPSSQIPKARQHIGSQNFVPGASFPQSISQPSPVFSFGAFPPMSPAPSSNNQAALPPLPFTRPTTSGASDSSHRRGKSDNAAVLDSLMKMLCPKPIDMPVDVMKSKEGLKEAAHEMDEFFASCKEPDNVSDVDDMEILISGGWENERRATSGVKRRAGKEIASVSLDFNLNGNSSYESPELPPHPDMKPGMFSEPQMETIVGCEKLREMALTNPKRVKRIFANRESAARSKDRKTQHLNELQIRVNALQHEVARLSANTMLMERSKSALEDENNQLRIRLQGMEEEAKLRDALINQLTGEVQRLKLATGEVMQNFSGYERSNTRSLDADLFHQLKINQEPQIYLGFE